MHNQTIHDYFFCFFLNIVHSIKAEKKIKKKRNTELTRFGEINAMEVGEKQHTIKLSSKKNLIVFFLQTLSFINHLIKTQKKSKSRKFPDTKNEQSV